MKFTKKLFASLAIVALLATSTQAQFLPSPSVQNFFNTPAPYLITASSITNIPSTNVVAVQLAPGQGFSFLTRFAAAGAGSNPLRFTFGVSQDGTNYYSLPTFPAASIAPLEFATAPNGTAQVVDFTNFPSGLVNNMKWVKVMSVSNTTAQVIGITNGTIGLFR